jgi:predicted RNase H-like nuclease (RuvC/YqgF family)
MLSRGRYVEEVLSGDQKFLVRKVDLAEVRDDSIEPQDVRAVLGVVEGMVEELEHAWRKNEDLAEECAEADSTIVELTDRLRSFEDTIYEAVKSLRRIINEEGPSVSSIPADTCLKLVEIVKGLEG